ncbi:MAG TPA: biosynthetic peptidoglycan transglycosylase [Trebonia sp.]|nr:biosynthetic peptidoglycan transglycosylase [Trebonia sp.]
MAPYGHRDTYDPGEAESTEPLPVIGVDDEADREQEGWAGEPPGKPPRHPMRTFLYRATLTITSIVACVLLAFALLLALTPSAGQATARAARLARAHHIAYPGPPVPANFSRPLIATEDHRFYSRAEVGGLDVLALGRAIRSVATGGPAQGGATIDVQLAKLLYVGADSPRHGTVKGDLVEVALAVKLSAMYGRPQILRLYAESAYYGNGYYGLQAASCGYFGHPPQDLTVNQGAMLAGVVNAPDFDDPITHPAQASTRLAHVIGRMVAVGYLTAQQGQQALSASLRLTPGHSPDC